MGFNFDTGWFTESSVAVTENFSIYNWMWVALAALVLIILLIVIIVVATRSKKKKSQNNKPAQAAHVAEATPPVEVAETKEVKEEAKPAPEEVKEQESAPEEKEAAPVVKEEPVKETKEPEKAKPAAKPVEKAKPAKPAAKPAEKSSPAAKPAEKKTATPAKVAPAKAAPAKSDAKLPTKTYHISLRKADGMWQVKAAGAEKAIKLFKTQAEAIEYCKPLAENQDANIVIHKKDGSFRKLTY